MLWFFLRLNIVFNLLNDKKKGIGDGMSFERV